MVEQDRPRKVHVIDQPISVCEGEALLAALPGPTDCLDILFDLDYPAVPSIGRQVLGFRLGKDDFAQPARPGQDLRPGGRGPSAPRARAWART